MQLIEIGTVNFTCNRHQMSALAFRVQFGDALVAIRSHKGFNQMVAAQQHRESKVVGGRSVFVRWCMPLLELW